jgi:hypothetical protein
VHQDNRVATLCLVQICGAQQHSHTLFADLPVNNRPEFAPRYRVHTHRRLIQQQQRRWAHQGAGEPQLLLHAAGKAAGQALHERRQAGHMHQFPVTAGTFGPGNPLQVGVQIQIFLHTQVFIQTEALRHVTNRRLNGERLGDNVDAQCVDAPLIGPQQPGCQPHQGGLAGAVRTDQAGDFARPDADVDRLQRSDHPARGGKALTDTREDQSRPGVHFNRPPARYTRGRRDPGPVAADPTLC